MGVDAHLFFRAPRALDDDTLRAWGFKIGERFYPSRFWQFDLDDNDGSAFPCLTRIRGYDDEGNDKVDPRGKTTISVRVATRHYGVGYERGDPLLIVGVADYIDTLSKSKLTWRYGGDATWDDAGPFGVDERAAMLKHWRDVAHRPYMRGWGEEGLQCPRCKSGSVSMSGSGPGSRTSGHCPGCGASVEKMDHRSPLTITPRERAWGEEQMSEVDQAIALLARIASTRPPEQTARILAQLGSELRGKPIPAHVADALDPRG